jgi:hypothetical protein
MVAALGANQPKQTPAGKMPWLLGDCLPTNQLHVFQLPSFLQPERPMALTTASDLRARASWS